MPMDHKENQPEVAHVQPSEEAICGVITAVNELTTLASVLARLRPQDNLRYHKYRCVLRDIHQLLQAHCTRLEQALDQLDPHWLLTEQRVIPRDPEDQDSRRPL